MNEYKKMCADAEKRREEITKLLALSRYPMTIRRIANALGYTETQVQNSIHGKRFGYVLLKSRQKGTHGAFYKMSQSSRRAACRRLSM